MKNIFKTFISLLAVAIFVLLNWATSQELTYIELQAEAMIYQDTLLILDNQDDLAINNAKLTLSNSQTITTGVAYTITGYSLASFSADTIELIDFIDDQNQPYPGSIQPNDFSLSFDVPENNAMAGFSTDL